MTGGQELCGLGTSPMICFDSDDLVPSYRLIIFYFSLSVGSTPVFRSFGYLFNADSTVKDILEKSVLWQVLLKASGCGRLSVTGILSRFSSYVPAFVPSDLLAAGLTAELTAQIGGDRQALLKGMSCYSCHLTSHVELPKI